MRKEQEKIHKQIKAIRQPDSYDNANIELPKARRETQINTEHRANSPECFEPSVEGIS